jgi:hypothetical protein
MSLLEETTPNIASNISGNTKNWNREVCLKIDKVKRNHNASSVT